MYKQYSKTAMRQLLLLLVLSPWLLLGLIDTLSPTTAKATASRARQQYSFQSVDEAYNFAVGLYHEDTADAADEAIAVLQQLTEQAPSYEPAVVALGMIHSSQV